MPEGPLLLQYVEDGGLPDLLRCRCRALHLSRLRCDNSRRRAAKDGRLEDHLRTAVVLGLRAVRRYGHCGKSPPKKYRLRIAQSFRAWATAAVAWVDPNFDANSYRPTSSTIMSISLKAGTSTHRGRCAQHRGPSSF